MKLNPIFLFEMEGPNQPSNIKFPKRKFGIKNPEERSFNPRWFASHRWLHYDEVSSFNIIVIYLYKVLGGRSDPCIVHSTRISEGSWFEPRCRHNFFLSFH